MRACVFVSQNDVKIVTHSYIEDYCALGISIGRRREKHSDRKLEKEREAEFIQKTGRQR